MAIDAGILEQHSTQQSDQHASEKGATENDQEL